MTMDRSSPAPQPAEVPVGGLPERLLWPILRIFLQVNPGQVINQPGVYPETANLHQELRATAQQLRAQVMSSGGSTVDYQSLRSSEAYRRLRHLTNQLPDFRLELLGGEDERRAFWINLYNTLILDSVVHFNIGGRLPLTLYQRAAYNVSGQRFSADDIEHGVLRGNRRHPLLHLHPFTASDPRLHASLATFDPRIHFALNCGARSCPAIRIYNSHDLDSQLAAATTSFIRGGGADVDLQDNVVWLSKIFDWYESDFGGRKRVLALVADHLADDRESHALRSNAVSIRYQSYDWDVNRVL
ncbi:MAG: DUF547 domain-containing protein [Anaerolineales bacterium]